MNKLQRDEFSGFCAALKRGDDAEADAYISRWGEEAHNIQDYLSDLRHKSLKRYRNE